MKIAENNDIRAESRLLYSVDKQDNKTDITGEKNDTDKSTENGVSLEISEEMMEMYRKQIEASDNAAESTEDYAKVMEIARRIANGDKVPYTDEKKLLEYSYKLYMAVKSAALINADKKHKEYDALFDEEDGNDIHGKLRDLDNGNKATVNETVPELDSGDNGSAEVLEG